MYVFNKIKRHCYLLIPKTHAETIIILNDYHFHALFLFYMMLYVRKCIVAFLVKTKTTTYAALRCRINPLSEPVHHRMASLKPKLSVLPCAIITG
jgi:hypothetical protein